MSTPKERKKQTKDAVLANKKQADQDKGGDTRQPAHLPGSTYFEQRYLGNNYLQSTEEESQIFRSEGAPPEVTTQEGTGKIIQTKLTVSQPGDKHEREADRIANLVVQMPEPMGPQQTEGEDLVQIEQLSDQIESFSQLEQATSEPPTARPEYEARIQSLKGGGQPLPAHTRAFFESHLGYDLSPVRIHRDEQAAEIAWSLNARAFTMGQDVSFGRGQFAPGTVSGQQLLAHELVHVIQQKGLPGNSSLIQMKRVKKFRYEKVVLKDIPFDPDPRLYLYFEVDVLSRIREPLHIPEPWGASLMWQPRVPSRNDEYSFKKGVYDKLIGISPPPKSVTIVVGFVKGRNKEDSRLYFYLLSTSMHPGRPAKKEITEATGRESPAIEQKQAKEIAPLPWTAEELKLWKEQEIRKLMKSGRFDEEKQMGIEEKYFMGEQVLKNWNNRYGKWTSGEAMDYWTDFFRNEMDPFGQPSVIGKFEKNDARAHRNLWERFLKKQIKGMHEWRMQVQNPFSSTVSRPEQYFRYQMEWESRDPTSFEFNIAYREFMRFKIDTKVIENLRLIGIPQTIIGKLQIMEQEDWIGEIPFFEALRNAIGDETQFQEYAFSIWREALIKGRVEPSPEAQERSKWLLKCEPFWYETKTNERLEWILNHWIDEAAVAYSQAVEETLVRRLQNADWDNIDQGKDRCTFSQEIELVNNRIISSVLCYGKNAEGLRFGVVVDLKYTYDEMGPHFVIEKSSDLLFVDDLFEVIGYGKPLPTGEELKVETGIQRKKKTIRRPE